MKTMHWLIFSGILFFSINFTFAQQGTIRGKIIDKENGEGLIAATVAIPELGKGATTDFDGNYSFKLDPGTYSIQISYISYETKVITDVVVTSGEVTIINAQLGTAAIVKKEFVVTAKATQKTESAMLQLQKKSPNALDGISSEQMSKLGDGTAAKALRRVTGVSVQNGKYVFVRGLSERYTTITLNNAIIPGLDPQKNTVQMDIFPSNVIENIRVMKTFIPSSPGSSTGGHVDVITRDFPEKYTFQFSTSISYNPQAHFNENSLVYDGGKMEFLGVDDGTRSIPDRAQQALDRVSENPNFNGILQFEGFTDTELGDIYNSFNKTMQVDRGSQPIDHGFKISVGNQKDVFGKPFGFNVGFSYDRSFEYFDGGEFAILEDNTDVPREYFDDSRSQMQVNMAALVNGNYKLNNNNKIGIRFLRSQSGNSITRYRDGVSTVEAFNIIRHNLGYFERSFNSIQLHGKHVLPERNNGTITWQSSYTHMVQDEPDLRFFPFKYEVTGEDTAFSMITNTPPVRFYREMHENDLDNKIDVMLPVKIKEIESKFHFGGATILKQTVSQENRFSLHNYNTNQNFDGDINTFLSSNIISGSNNAGIYYKTDENNDLTRSYEAESQVFAAYGHIDMPIKKLRVVTGVRYEYSHIFTANSVDKSDKNYDEGEITEYLDFLPSVNLTYSINDSMNFRMAATQTLARPSFKEIAPYNYYDYRLGIRINGNPDLERSKITNFDIRYEWFFGLGEIVALSGFFKYFDMPIEQTYDINSSNPEIIFQNSESSYLYGIEAELRKKLAFVEALKNFSFGANLTLVKSAVRIPEDEFTNIKMAGNTMIEEIRPMFGQAPYVVNTYLSYRSIGKNLEANIAFNVSGEKLIVYYNNGTPFVYEQPAPSLNFNLSKGIGENISLSLSVNNILDSEIHAEYHLENKDVSYFSYRLGRVYGLSFSYLVK
jgi:hypothetical protein